MNFLKLGWFKNDTLKTIYKFLNAYYKKYEQIPKRGDVESVFKNECYSSQYANIKPMLDSLYAFEESKYSDKFIKDNIVKFTKARAIYFAIFDNISEIEEKGEIGGCLSQFESIVRMEMSSDLGTDYFKKIDKHIEKLQEVNSRIPVGIKEFDRMTYGGLPKDDTCLWIIMAQPGLGKSQLLGNIAYNWIRQNKKVLIISLEMSEQMYSARLSSLIAGTNINTLKNSTDRLKRVVTQLHDLYPESGLYIKEYPTGTCTAAHLRQFIRKLKESKDFVPDIIMVDYLNIMKPNGNPSNVTLYEKGTLISEELRALSSELKKPILAPIQTARRNGGYAREDIDIDSASESSGIVATADGILALFQSPEDRINGCLNAKMLKNRLGGYVGAIFRMQVNYDTLRITDWPDDEDDSAKTPEELQKKEELNQKLNELQEDKTSSDKALTELDECIGGLKEL
ncbi:MAG: hypothetical protein J6J11_09125 [Treponema sp.]|nr:hypothetical protein [Clostridia bacterium]MBP3608460.1 hypothetical protein [Treponema sp.]